MEKGLSLETSSFFKKRWLRVLEQGMILILKGDSIQGYPRLPLLESYFPLHQISGNIEFLSIHHLHGVKAFAWQ